MKETWEYIVRTMKNTASLRKARPAKLMGFSPKLNILPEPQRALWKELAATPKQFVLYGGTALALRLGHRVSEDFDFFTNRPFEPRDLLERIPFLGGGKAILLRENTLTCVLDRNGQFLCRSLED